MLTEHDPVRVELFRDRHSSFAPILIPKHERCFTAFDNLIITMYVRGMSVREIQAIGAESHGTEVSPDFISSVTDEVMAETISWQNRPLDAMCPGGVLSFPPDIRRVIYPTSAIESLNIQLRKIKLLWPALRNVLAKSYRATFD
ncbi:hypothetical protein LMG6000_00423 [Achromobacter insolitus]|uniref:Mutator family transposase n=1 Tax=Achromobacter insolitus TaxID=217204 RepID=A0A6S7F4K9_9BURK|nr:hypothetical protein LMG6000_00423 [Achromobacter insolitus]CAB3944851.1 hypothetical protein LMG5997_05474 [Achromobacter insolitus]